MKTESMKTALLKWLQLAIIVSIFLLLLLANAHNQPLNVPSVDIALGSKDCPPTGQQDEENLKLFKPLCDVDRYHSNTRYLEN